jgi:hypothetical protein
MRKENIHCDLSALAFDFFYWFSRFEFALKENQYLKSHKPDSNADPGWSEYVMKWQPNYNPSAEASELLQLLPQRQIVLEGDALDWKPLDLSGCKSSLDAVVLCLKTIRNNLFHGGKHSCEGWDDPMRNHALLTSGKAVLSQLAKLGDIEADYLRLY